MTRAPKSSRPAHRGADTMAISLNYRRLVVELARGASDPATLAAAAAFAHLLDLELLGLFIEDEALLAVADLPFVREIRLPTHRWDPIDPARLKEELRQHAALMQQRWQEAVRAYGVANAFEIMRGDPAACLAERSGESDIVVLAAPAGGSPGSAMLVRVREAAHQACSSVLLVPPGLRRVRGPIAVVLALAEDHSLETAADIAAAAGERLLVLAAEGTQPKGIEPTDAAQQVLARAAARGVGAERVMLRPLPGLQRDDVATGLAGARERLIVMTRGAEPASEIDAASYLAYQHRVPVLLVMPPRPNTGV